MNMDMDFINDLVKKTVEATTLDLKKQGLIRTNKHTTFQKTETLLYNYPKFKASIADKLEDLEGVKKYGLGNRSKSIILREVVSSADLNGEWDKQENAKEKEIAKLTKSIEQMELYIGRIERVLNRFEDDPYFEIIPMKYFEGKSRDYIAEYFDVDSSTISRHKNRLLNEMKIKFFPEEVIEELNEFEV